jgi:gliding motility-associated-like protein
MSSGYDGTSQTYTITGTPTVENTYNYTITTTGSCGTQSSLTGTITVGLGLASNSGNPVQEVCRLSSIDTIRFNYVGGSAVAVFSPSIPNGIDTLSIVTSSGRQFKIFGTPTLAGTFNYTVTAKGSCSSASTLYGSVTVGVGSPVGNTTPRGCIDVPIAPITYALPSFVTGVNVQILPPGVTYTLTSTIPKQVTISGTPTAAGSFHYTLTTISNCPNESVFYGTITVDNDTIKLSSGNPYQKICIGNPIKPLSYIVSGTGTAGQASGDGLSQIYPSKTFTVNFTPPAAAGTYTYTVKTSGGCLQGVAVSTFTIEVLNPQASFAFDPNGGTPPLDVNFTNTSIGATSFVWNFGDGNTSTNINPTNNYTAEGAYDVVLTAKIQSSDSVCKTSVKETVTMFKWNIPNVFTPNGDGTNDVFGIKSIGVKEIDGEIFNRWGTKVHEWHNQDDGWNGKDRSTGADCPTGTYYYIIKITDINNKYTLIKDFFLLAR